MLLAALMSACASEITGTGEPSATRLYYYEAGDIWSATLGKSTKKRVIRVESEIGGVATTRKYLFWASYRGCSTARSSESRFPRCNGLYRANRDGTHRVRLVEKLRYPSDLVVASGRAYWIDEDRIGRVNLDGSGVERSFVRPAKEDAGFVAEALATDGTYLYFTRCGTGAIARVRLDGTELNRAFISLPRVFRTSDQSDRRCPQPLAYAAGYLYWGELGDSGQQLIGRASVDGQHVESGWLDAGPGGLFQLAAGSGMLFWAWRPGAGAPVYIGQASLDAKILNRRFAVGSTADVGP